MVGLATVASHAMWLAWLRLILGIILISEGALLATDAAGARRLLVSHLQHTRPRGARTALLKTRPGELVVSLALQLFGVVWLPLGLLLVALAISRLL